MSAKFAHVTIAGDPREAILHGLTVRAKCGLVFQPTTTDVSGIPDCTTCHAEGPHRLPGETNWIYRYFDRAGRLLYVGVSAVPKQRDEQHRLNSWWYPQVASARVIVFPNREYALHKEREAIATEAPLWNVRGQSSKHVRSIDEYRHMHAQMLAYGVPEKRINRVRLEALRHHDVDLTETLEATA